MFLAHKTQKIFFCYAKINIVNKKAEYEEVEEETIQEILQGACRHKEVRFYQLWICTGLDSF